MKRQTTTLFAALLGTALLAPAAAMAQDPGSTLAAAPAEAAEGEEDEAASDPILEVLDLPLIAVELREESGIQEAEIVGAIEVAQERGVNIPMLKG